MSIDDQHAPTVSYWQAIAEQAQAEAKQRLDDWCKLKEQAEASQSTIASQQLTIQGMIAEGDAQQARVEAADDKYHTQCQYAAKLERQLDQARVALVRVYEHGHQPGGINADTLLLIKQALATTEPPRRDP